MKPAHATWQERYQSRFYDKSRGFIDGTAEFHSMCRQAIAQGARILEIGAGPSNPSSRFLAGLGDVVGVDVDAEVKRNDALREAYVISGDQYPVEENAFDAAVSNYVLEHVSEPREHLREVFRVLKPGGVYLFRTPNRYHYVALVSSLTPHWVHVALANRLRGLDPDSHEPYPTVYRLNTRADILRHAQAAGFSVEELRMVEKEPSYGMISRLLFFPFMAYERLVNASDFFGDLRANIFGVLRKPRA